MFLVTGASGNVGAEVVAALLAAGEQVRALTRGAGSGLPDGVEVRAGDLDRPDTVRAAASGVEGVFLLPGFEDSARVLAAERTGVRPAIVLLSGASAADGDAANAVSAYMARSEAAVRASGLPWTILRPSAFMSNALRWRDELCVGDVVHEPFPNVATASIDPGDIAAVAARALRDEGLWGRILRLSGPEALLPAERLRILGEELYRELRLVGLSLDEARRTLGATMPAEYVDAFFRFYVDGTLDESPVLPTVEQITGRRPRTFREWARAHAEAFDRPAETADAGGA